jgi:hypothetical protein
MKKTSFIAIAVIIFLSACKSKATETASEKEAYQKATKALEEREKKNPASFLTVNSHDKSNLIGQTVIKGTIDNTAKVCTYKDVQLELSFFSKTGTLLEKDIETIYDLVAPGKSIEFKTKYFAPKKTDSVAIKVLGAKINN